MRQPDVMGKASRRKRQRGRARTLRATAPPGGSAKSFQWGEHTARYLVVSDYAPRFLQSRGTPYDDDAWGDALLKMCPLDSLLVALSAATRAADNGKEALDEWGAYVLGHLDADLAHVVRDALHRPDGGPPRVLIARQPLLLAVRLALTAPPTPTQTGDPFVVATLLSHFAARNAYSGKRPGANQRRVGGLSEHLAMEVVANSLFNMSFDFGDLLARTRLLWTTYEGRLERYRPRKPLRDLLSDATGLSLDDLLVLAFGVYAHAIAAAPGAAQPLDLATLGLPQETVDRFLARFALTPSELGGVLVGQEGNWAFLQIEDTPLLRLDASGQLVVALDIRLLQRRFTSALYWLVHDHEKSIGEAERRAWTQVYSELLELYAEDILAEFGAGDGRVFFTEESLVPLGSSAVDCGIDFGDFVLLTDVVQHQMTVPTRMLCELPAFERDMRATVLKKVKQLDGSVTALLERTNHPAHPLGRRPTRILPVVVQGADFPVNPVTVRYAREQAAEAGFLWQSECAQLMICTLEELEMVATAVTNGVGSAEEIWLAYAASGAEDALKTFISDRFPGQGWERPHRMQEALDEVFDLVNQAYAHLDDDFGEAGETQNQGQAERLKGLLHG